MSFEVFVQCYTDGKPDGVSATEIQKAFGPHLQIKEGNWWKAVYDNESDCAILVSFLPADRGLVHGLTVLRPCADQRLWDGLLALLRFGHLVLYFPAAEPPLLVAEESVSAHLPEGMVEVGV